MSRYHDRNPTRIIKAVEPADPIGGTSQKDYEDNMRDGSRLLLWRIARLQAQRENALEQFYIMQEMFA